MILRESICHSAHIAMRQTYEHRTPGGRALTRQTGPHPLPCSCLPCSSCLYAGCISYDAHTAAFGPAQAASEATDRRLCRARRKLSSFPCRDIGAGCHTQRRAHCSCRPRLKMFSLARGNSKYAYLTMRKASLSIYAGRSVPCAGTNYSCEVSLSGVRLRPLSCCVGVST